jgi:hypothetical protein
LLSQ